MGSSRRVFLERTSRWGLLLAGAGATRGLPLLDAPLEAGQGLADLARVAPRARYWVSSAAATDCAACHDRAPTPSRLGHVHRGALVGCRLCARNCTILDGDRGLCRARVNVKGELRSLVYGRPMAVHVDPIEKKPFYHFLPGRAALSLATSGCPLRCRFCQNWEISQARAEDYSSPVVPPEKITGAARDRGAPVIAFTYNEPTVFTEYMTDIARAARPVGLRPVLVSCGFMNQAPLDEMCDTLDAIKIDLKGMSEEFYRTVVGAELGPVLRSIKQVARRGVHLEIVNLVVPTLNDAEPTLVALAKWMIGEVGPDVPLHFTRFHPDYQLANLPPTPIATLERARDIARAHGLRYVYVGNVPGHPGNNTWCPRCGKPVIERDGFLVVAQNLKDGRCSACGQPVPGVWT